MRSAATKKVPDVSRPHRQTRLERATTRALRAISRFRRSRLLIEGRRRASRGVSQGDGFLHKNCTSGSRRSRRSSRRDRSFLERRTLFRADGCRTSTRLSSNGESDSQFLHSFLMAILPGIAARVLRRLKGDRRGHKPHFHHIGVLLAAPVIRWAGRGVPRCSDSEDDVESPHSSET